MSKTLKQSTLHIRNNSIPIKSFQFPISDLQEPTKKVVFLNNSQSTQKFPRRDSHLYSIQSQNYSKSLMLSSTPLPSTATLNSSTILSTNQSMSVLGYKPETILSPRKRTRRKMTEAFSSTSYMSRRGSVASCSNAVLPFSQTGQCSVFFKSKKIFNTFIFGKPLHSKSRRSKVVMQENGIGQKKMIIAWIPQAVVKLTTES